MCPCARIARLEAFARDGRQRMDMVKSGGDRMREPGTVAALRTIKALTAGYLGLSVITLVVAAVFRDDAAMVNDAVWIRGTFVLLSAVVMMLLAARVARGSRGAYRRMRIIAVVVVVAIAVIASWPGLLPVWMRAEQVVCGLLLLGVVLQLFGRRLRWLSGGSA